LPIPRSSSLEDRPYVAASHSSREYLASNDLVLAGLTASSRLHYTPDWVPAHPPRTAHHKPASPASPFTSSCSP
jgi:hypothetical protein